MTDPTPPFENLQRAADIRAMVEADFERVSQTRDPYRVLNLGEHADIETARARFDRYERFYRVDNFRRFDDPGLLARAQEIREAISQAMVALNGRQNTGAEEMVVSQEGPVGATPDPDCIPLGDIYFRDGLTYLKLGDLSGAENCLQRAVEHDPNRGILLAYLHYARYKLRNNDPSVVEASARHLQRAARMDPQNVEVFVIMARFGINTKDPVLANEAIDRVEALRPEHAKLAQLRKRVARL